MSFAQIKEKIKPLIKFDPSFVKTIYLALIFALSISLGFGVFYAHKTTISAVAPSIEKRVFSPKFDILDPEKGDMAGKIGASVTGSVYYYSNCSGLSRIKPENRMYFDSVEDAEMSGLSLAKNCKKP